MERILHDLLNASGASSISLTVPSATSTSESIRLATKTEAEIAQEYMSKPPLPYNQRLRIDRIAVLNMDISTKETFDLLTYKSLRVLDPEQFYECKDPKLDYEDHEQVSPTYIISGDTTYRTNMNLWFPLSDIVTGICRKQAKEGRKLLPIEVFLDERNQWMCELFNLVGKDGQKFSNFSEPIPDKKE